MTDEEIRKKYQRDGGPLGENERAITKFINMIHAHENSNNEHVQSIIQHIDQLSQIAPNFNIFESKERTFYMRNFNALQLSTNEDELTDAHEFGHAILNIANDLQVPEGFEDIVRAARANCINDRNKQNFIKYMEYLSDKENAERTNAEKGPLSDIISSIFQYPALKFAQTGKTCVFPSSHSRDYYFDEEKGRMKEKAIFDEDFANFYTLVANNCTRELEILQEFLGEDWMQVMTSELEKAAHNLEISHEKTQPDVKEQIKGAIIAERAGDIPNELQTQKSITKEERERGE